MSANLNELMNQFRLASRELFNHFFRGLNPSNNNHDAWLQEERFQEVQALLFQKMVAEPMSMNFENYGKLQPNLLVKLRYEGVAPIMLNREIDSGYWDYPINEVNNDAQLIFVNFFDWDQLDYRDNRYVRVQVLGWPAHPDVDGKHGLIESQYVHFAINFS